MAPLGRGYCLVGALGNAVLRGTRSHDTIKGFVLSIMKPCCVGLLLRSYTRDCVCRIRGSRVPGPLLPGLSLWLRPHRPYSSTLRMSSKVQNTPHRLGSAYPACNLAQAVVRVLSRSCRHSCCRRCGCGAEVVERDAGGRCELRGPGAPGLVRLGPNGGAGE